MNVTQINKRLARTHAEYRAAGKNQAKAKKKLAGLEKQAIDYKEALTIAQAVSKELQQQAHSKIGQIVTTCLQDIFGPGYAFRIDFETKRNRTEANLVLIKDGHDIGDPLNDDSGGVADVASFALRLSCLMLTKPHLRRLVVLDEPFKFVSAEYQPAIVTMLEELSEDLDMQIVMVTHIEALEVGRLVRL